MSRNDITGDSLATRPSSDAYREGHDRIWGNSRREILNEDAPQETGDAAIDAYQDWAGRLARSTA